ncbi:MAG TPA: ROK family protein [Pseudoclavibacter sp.]|nr:ROK family protein [Pseudoclavibacter sp.]
MAYTIGIDVGGTKVAAGVLDEWGKRIDEIKYPSDPTDSEAMFELLVRIIKDFASQYSISGAGVALPSMIDKAQRYVYTSANLDWENEPLVDRMEERLGLPILLDNDANAAGWAEFHFGAGKGYRDGLMLTIGTGIGGAVILNGELYRGGFGLAGEPGHMRLVPGGRPCGCGCRGCFEQYGSGSALTRAARELAQSDDPLGAGLAAIQAEHGQLTGGLIHQALRAGDPGAAHVLAITGDYVGQGIASIASLLDPEVVVIGGGVAATGELFYSAIVDGYRNNLPSAGHRPELAIELAALGNDAGWVGAADLIRRKLDD